MTLEAAKETVIRLASKSLGYMDQGMGHGHFGWIPLSQEEFITLRDALQVIEQHEGKLKILARALNKVVMPYQGKYIGPSESDADLTPEVGEAMKIVESLDL